MRKSIQFKKKMAGLRQIGEGGASTLRGRRSARSRASGPLGERFTTRVSNKEALRLLGEPLGRCVDCHSGYRLKGRLALFRATRQLLRKWGPFLVRNIVSGPVAPLPQSGVRISHRCTGHTRREPAIGHHREHAAPGYSPRECPISVCIRHDPSAADP